MKALKVLYMVLLVVFFASSAFAKIWHVDRNTGNNADFTFINDAIAAASAGDTIYVAGSGAHYGSITLTKKLILIGSGYFLGENPKTQLLPIGTKIGEAIFKEGSEGSILEGFECTGSIQININNITIKNNFLIEIFNGWTILYIPVSNTIISNNYIKRTINMASSINTIIANNYIKTSFPSETNIAIYSTTGSSSTIQNNVIAGDMEVINSLIRNNILTRGELKGTSLSLFNNISVSNQFGTANGNLSITDLTTVFAGAEGNSTDGQWKLKEGSPAIGAGVNGEDIGMFGGIDPYVLSGIPPIPHIYFFTAPISGSGTLGLPIKMKAKSGGN